MAATIGLVGSAPGRASVEASPTVEGTQRQYYIAAETVTWDVAPEASNVITGRPFGPVEETFVRTGPGRIGSRHGMSLYRQYTDATFTTAVERPAEDAYMGILGPVMRAEVGDTIDVVFLNRTSYPATIHPHGVEYRKDSEGAPYEDTTSGADKADDAVPTGGTVTYHWEVPERAGPGPMDPSSIVWMYHSHWDEVRDTNSGLVGALIVSRKGSARPDGSPVDVDREIFSFFSVLDQNQSWYLEDDLARVGAREPEDEDEDFEESNLLHGINGFLYGNGPMAEVVQGTRVRWYLLTLGTEVDLHTPHWHGNTVLMNGMNRADMVQLLPGGMLVADMVPDAVGIWLFHCHVNDHLLAGMVSRYQVLPAGTALGAEAAAGSSTAEGARSASDTIAPSPAEVPMPDRQWVWCLIPTAIPDARGVGPSLGDRR